MLSPEFACEERQVLGRCGAPILRAVGKVWIRQAGVPIAMLLHKYTHVLKDQVKGQCSSVPDPKIKIRGQVYFLQRLGHSGNKSQL